ncbi:hypothetical protein QN357_11255 [Cryobacterium sp. RTC2.1]|uniref:hypothetical protein n=1 Tax=Cryobacterium sp. RTC2.1 TaxID=3048634 RepID=UPI002B23514B|nr:hypothetical protein [Cryobacterium sp. RTC2.1]MEB0003504.1 hypothetical protein [Cryobacterium sp. RTC2.1]
MTFFDGQLIAAPKKRRNPFELTLAYGSLALITGGLIMWALARQEFGKEFGITDLASVWSTGGSAAASQGSIMWMNIGVQLLQLGVLILVGLTFHLAAKWNTDRRAERR